MANIGELSVGVKVDDKSLNKATKEVQTEFKKTGDSVEKNFTKRTTTGAGKIRKAFGGLGGMIAGVFSIVAITNFTKSLFTLGSDLEEVTSKFNVVFNSSQEVKQNFEDLASATNRSSLDLLTFGANLGDVLKPLGLAQEDVDGLSVGLTQLAIDVASFNNATDDQVINAFRSALTGEREALKTLGIVISEADVKQKAYNLGLAESGDELTKQQKALATYQLLIENTTDAHGDAIRTGESFANQLKGLRGAIKDVFANAGKDVAQGTAGLLKTLTIFVSSYGEAIITTIAETGKVIGGVIADTVKTFGDLFGVIRTGTTESGDDMANFAFIFQKVVQGFGVGIKLISTIFKSLVDIIAIALGVILEYWKATFKSIDDIWNILKTTVIGTLETIVDAVVLQVKIIAQLFVGMAEAIVGVFKGIAVNVGVAVKKAGNVAISGLNSVIDAVNKLPGVNIDQLLGFDDANFKPFELKVGKNIDKLKGQFAEFGKDVKGNYEGIGESFGNIASNYGDGVDTVVGVSKEAFKNMGEDWAEFGDHVVDGNERIENSIKDGQEKARKNAELYEKGYFSILDLVDKYKGSVDDANDKTEAQGKIAEETIDKIKDQYKDWEKSIETVNKAQEKLAEDTIKYNQEIEDSIRSLGKELSDTTGKYEDAVGKIQSETAVDIAQRGVDVATDLAKINEEIAKAKKDEDRYSIENVKKLKELEQEKLDLLKEQEFIVANTSDAQRLEAERRAGLSEAETIKEDADNEIAEQTRVFDAEKKRLEELQRINKIFLDLKKLDQQSLDQLLADERFKNFSQEEQDLILKLARDKIQLTAQKDAIILQQQEIAQATVSLSNSATAVQMANISTIKSGYADIIDQINQAIVRQQRLNALKSGGGSGFAEGGFTGAGGTNEVAGVVHKGEWVAPKWMVNSMKPLFNDLESKRGKGFAEGGFTTNNNKTQNNDITVNNGMDLRGFMDYAKWKL